MSHSQFHCTVRVYLDMHGLIFETSICYWQDQPGSRAKGRRPDAPDPPTTAQPFSLSPSGPTRSARGARLRRLAPNVLPFAGRRRRPTGRTPLGGEGGPPRRSHARSRGRADRRRERRARSPKADPRASPTRGRSGRRCAARVVARLFAGGALRAHAAGAGRAARHGTAAPAGADPPSGTGGRAGNGTPPPETGGRARGEGDLEADAAPTPETLSRGGTRSAAGGNVGRKPHARGPRRPEGRRGGRRTPPALNFLAPRLASPNGRFPSFDTPPPCCSRPALAGSRTGVGAGASLTTHWVLLRLAGPLGRHTAGLGRASSRPLSERAGERLTSRTTGSEPERRPPVPEHRTPQRLPRDGERRSAGPPGALTDATRMASSIDGRNGGGREGTGGVRVR